MRRLTEGVYATEIQARYAHAETLSANNIPILKATFEADVVRKFVRALIVTILPQTLFSDDEDLFKYGLDSIKILEALNGLKVGLRKPQKSLKPSWLTTKFLYSGPTISHISGVIEQFFECRNHTER